MASFLACAMQLIVLEHSREHKHRLLLPSSPITIPFFTEGVVGMFDVENMSVGSPMLDFVIEKKQIIGFAQIDFVSFDSFFCRFCL